MKGILDKIVQQKHREVAELKERRPFQTLKKEIASTQADSISMKAAILEGSGVIAEFKRASPSKGIISENALPDEIALSYEKAGASAISVLTDNAFFQGSSGDLQQVKNNVMIPVLRKDFTIDPYQIYEAKLLGADCILLIGAILTKAQIADFLQIAADLGMEAILEVHTAEELDKLSGREEIIGVNNRNLNTFEVDIANSIQLSAMLGNAVKIAESGLSSGANLNALVEAGFDGFLIGESFMKAPDPGAACRDFIAKIGAK